MRFTVTLGPASADDAIIIEILSVADRFRLNASHLSPESLGVWLEKLTRIYEEQRRSLRVVVDLQGAKMRIGSYPKTEKLPDSITLLHTEKSLDPAVIPVPEELFFNELKAGDAIVLNDARVELKIMAVDKKEQATATVVRNGPLSSSKGINRAPHPIPYTVLSKRDESMIAASKQFPFVEYAFSFVNDGSEAAIIRPHISGKRLAAKIERLEAMSRLDAIIAQFDELWLCRGDLGAEAGLAALGALQARFVRTVIGEQKPTTPAKPAFLAGQVLEYMTHFPQPTRSEVVHLYDARAAGFEGAVLSDETAVGRNPLAVCRFLKLLKC